ncbi:cytochrome P450 [Hysterangium stoloniferum]|nr:cytochrome P450 [Hysterangium stoloniferum]
MYAAFAYTAGLITLGLIIVDYVWYTARRMPTGTRLPPGPRRKPIIGNLLDLPKYHETETVAGWSKQYGDMIYLNCLGNPMLFVNSDRIAHDLFEKRSSIYSDRYGNPMLYMAGWKNYLAFLRYGNVWRRQRRMLHLHFNANAVAKYYPVQVKYSRLLLRQLLDTPDDYVEPLKYLAGAIIMEIAYGIKLETKGDRYVEIAHQAIEPTMTGMVPWGFMVDLLPLLRHVPQWFPGAKFKKEAARWLPPTKELATRPYNIANGTAMPSLVATDLNALLSQADPPKDGEDIIMNSYAIAYIAGAGTTVSAMLGFIVAMLQHPECQRKAQAELDGVVGEDRLPTFEDRAALPYVNAVAEEVQRWHPVIPFAIPHASTEDDVYGEYFIPKGTILIPNSWAMLHNEAKYGPNTGEFNPDRFFTPGFDKSAMTAMWGQGRRMCVGRHLSTNTLFLVVACILKVFDIVPAKDAQGNDIPITGEYTSGSIVEPEPFPCVFKPRSELCKKIILEQIVDD